MSRLPSHLGRKNRYKLKVSDLWHLGNQPPPFSIFFFFLNFLCFSSCLWGVLPTGWLSTQEKIWCGCDWQGHDVLSGRLCVRNKTALGNCNGMVSRELSWKCLSTIGMLVLLYRLSFYYPSAILGRRERSLLFPMSTLFFPLSPLPVVHRWNISAMPGGWYVPGG